MSTPAGSMPTGKRASCRLYCGRGHYQTSATKVVYPSQRSPACRLCLTEGKARWQKEHPDKARRNTELYLLKKASMREISELAEIDLLGSAREMR